MSKPDLSSNRQTHIQRLYNARYAKLGWQVGKRYFYPRKIREAKELLNSAMLFIYGKCHVFLKEVIKVFGRKPAWIVTLNNVHSLIRIKLPAIIRHMRRTVSCNKYTFAIERPIAYSRCFFCASEERIFSANDCRIRIQPTCTNTDEFTQNLHKRCPFV